MHDFPKVTAVVPVHNGKKETLGFLASIAQATYPNLRVVVVDDGSVDGTAAAIQAAYPDVKVVSGDGDLWWSGGVNLGVARAIEDGTDFVLIINNDTTVEPGFLEPLVETSKLYERGIVTSKIYDYDDRSFVCSFGAKADWLLGEIRDVTNRRDRVDFNTVRECDWVNGSSTLLPVAVFREIGLFDREECPQYHGDAEFCFRARRRGYRVFAEPRSIVYRKTKVSAGNRSLDSDSLPNLLKGVRSPFYLRANRKVYREYCPYRPYLLFLGIRYARLAYSLLRRTFIDRTRH